MVEIYDNGDVVPCESLKGDNILGNLRDSNYNIKSILTSKKAKNIIKNIRKSKCFCTFECAILNNIIFNPKAYPRLLKEVIIN